MRRFERVLKIAFVLVFIVALFVFSIAVFKQVDPGEAYIGSFDSNLLDDGWTIIYPDGHVEENVSIPLDIDVEAGSVLAIEHTLPDDVGDGMRLGLRSSREEMTVYIADEQRSEYKVEDFIVKRKSVVSAFILVDLKDADAGQTLRIEMSSPSDPVIRINDINYAYGNNVWFSYIGHNINLVFIAILMICIGMFAIVVFLFIRKKVAEAKSVFYHAQTIIIAGLWMLSESELRQVIFHSPSLSNVFSFMLIEIIAAFGSMYCNEVQKHHYARIYTLLQSVILLQVLANIVLNVTGVVDFYDTLILSHAWSALMIIVVAGTLIVDGITGRIRRYGFTAIGMVLLVIFSMLEIVNFYFINIVSMGFLLGIGLLMLLAFTTVQVVIDLIRSAEKRRRDLEKANRTTFQTIASTIDAKDRYTGGHSERVGHYAKLICKAVADEYGFTHDAISAVNYIGKMHDIGKIGVPDKVLNKNGRLTDEEFDLMKQHTIIGYDMLKNIDYIPGLRDGVRSYHERWDGGGYPDGLKGEKIPLYARILCIADSYDAMTTDRVYRKKLSKETVLEELEKNKGKQFDPHLADVFIGMIRGGVV